MHRAVSDGIMEAESRSRKTPKDVNPAMKIGMIGGIGPESTVDYYKRLVRRYQETVNANEYPEILINSVNMTAMLRLVAQEDWAGLTAMLSGAVRALAQAGAAFAFIASNTPHVVFEQVQQASPIPMISIVEATCARARALGLRKAGLLGTLFTMQSDFYPAAFRRAGIATAAPQNAERRYIQEKLFTEIERGVFLPETRAGLLQIIQRMIAEDGIDGVILGCTELPLILTESALGIPFLNTTEIHVEQIIETLRKQ